MFERGSSAGFLGENDVPPVEIIHPEATTPLMLTGDHAGNAVPKALGDLGLRPGELSRHIGWDIGIADVTRRLAARLKATAVLARYSRLIIDPNRPLGDPQSIPASSDGTAIAANQHLTEDERARRAHALYWPYHCAIDQHLGRLQRLGRVPILLAMHSFTPALNTHTAPRPWHVGVLFGRDERLSRLLVRALKARGDLVVGSNEPYSGMTHGYGLKVHGIAHGLPHAELEIRQDLITSPEGQQYWADLLADVLAPILAHDDIKTIEHY
jgi:predicted N-formylglutamate amidohydrolase